MIEKITYGNTMLALIVYKTFDTTGVEFLTEHEDSLQVGCMRHPKGHEILPHVHTPIHRETSETHEVLFIKEGLIRIDFFSHEQKYLESRTIGKGDMVLLVGAGHGITMLESTVIVEVKNGPYYPDLDKERFPNPITSP